MRRIDTAPRRAYAYPVTDSCLGAASAGERRLSKRFYDVLGEDIANELVDWFNAVDLTPRFARGGLYRADLRELNELNFARFEAKLEQRLAEVRSELLVELRTGLQQVRTEIQQARSELLRWMFGFWVTIFIGIAGLAVALR